MIIKGESLYDFYKRNKICVYCGQENAAPNRVSCINCLEKQREAQRRLREKETPEKREKRLEYSREYNRKKREERKNTGKCIHCDKKVIKPGTSFCLEHYIKNKKNNDKRKQPNRNYFTFNGYGNIISFNYIYNSYTDEFSYIYVEDLADYIIENENAFCNDEIQEILDDENEE